MKNKRQVIIRQNTTFLEYGEQILNLKKKRISTKIVQGKPTMPQYKVIIPYMFSTIKELQERNEQLERLLLDMTGLARQMATVISEIKNKC